MHDDNWVAQKLAKADKTTGVLLAVSARDKVHRMVIRAVQTLVKQKKLVSVSVICPDHEVKDSFIESTLNYYPRTPVYYRFYSYENVDQVLTGRSMLVFLEAHHLNEGDLAEKAMTSSIKCRYTVMATGYPMVSDAANMAPLLVMTLAKRDRTDFPVSRHAFHEKFDSASGRTRFYDLFKDRLYYDAGQSKNMPVLNMREHTVPMSVSQKLTIDADLEIMSTEPKLLKAYKTYLATGKLPHKTDPLRENVVEYVERNQKLSNASLPSRKCDPKVRELVKAMISGPKPAIAYSSFDQHGTELIRLCLLQDKYIQAERIAFLTDESKDEDKALVKSGLEEGRFHFLISTRRGLNGLKIKGVRQFHMLEPCHNGMRRQQLLSKVRFEDSHAHLNDDERFLNFIQWISDKPSADASIQMLSKKKRETIDEYYRRIKHLHRKSSK